jgi:hypothetical protein
MKHIVKSIKNCLKQGDALSPLFSNFTIEYTIRKVQETQVGLKLNGTHQLLVNANDATLLGDDIDTVTKNTETLTDTKEIILETKVEKTKYMLLYHHKT